MAEPDDELRRLAREAADAARAAQAAAERVAREQPTRWESILAAITSLVTTLVDALTHRLRDAADGARRAGEEAVARALLALSRSVGHLARAASLAFVAALLTTVAVVTLTFGLAVLLNQTLGDPYGTLLVGLTAALLAAVLALLARRRLVRIAEEARLLSPPRAR